MGSLRASRALAAVAALAALACSSATHALDVESTVPVRNGLNAPRTPAIEVRFDKPVSAASVTDQTFRVWGRSIGRMTGVIAFENGGQRLVFTPSKPFFPGETV